MKLIYSYFRLIFMETESNLDSIQALLLSNPALKRLNEKRIICSFTKHEIPCTEKAILQHINGKRYIRLNKSTSTPPSSSENSFETYQPHITPSKKKGHENQLFCTLTLRHINKIHHHVERHVNGRKFKNAKARWEKCQQTGETFVPTPMQNRNKRNNNNKDNDKDEGSEQGDMEDGPPADDLSDLYPDMDFNKLTLQEEIVEEKVLSHLKQKKRKRRKRTSRGASVVATKKKQQQSMMNVDTAEDPVPSKQIKVTPGVGGSELLVFN